MADNRGKTIREKKGIFSRKMAASSCNIIAAEKTSSDSFSRATHWDHNGFLLLLLLSPFLESFSQPSRHTSC